MDAKLDRAQSTVGIALTSVTGRFHNPAQPSTVKLNDKVRWRLRISGGSTTFDLNLAGGRVSGIELSAGAAKVTAALPAPSGTIRVSATGGASTFAFSRPAGVAARASLSGGAGSLEADGQSHSQTDGTAEWSSAGYSSAGDRYDIAVEGGADRVVISSR